MIGVRPANHSDLDWLLGEMRAFADFVDTKKSVFPTDEIARELVTGFIERHACFIAEYEAPDGITQFPRTGFTIAILHPHIFNPAITVLTEMFWWVRPEYRGTRSGALLLRELERVGRELADWTVISLEAKSPVNPSTLCRRGFRLLEQSYLREQ